MTKLKLNKTIIYNEVIPPVEKSINYLNDIINNIGILRIPNDFEYAEYLKNLISEIKRLSVDLEFRKNKLNNSVKAYSKLEKENANLAFDVKNVRITSRKGILK